MKCVQCTFLNLMWYVLNSGNKYIFKMFNSLNYHPKLDVIRANFTTGHPTPPKFCFTTLIHGKKCPFFCQRVAMLTFSGRHLRIICAGNTTVRRPPMDQVVVVRTLDHLCDRPFLLTVCPEWDWLMIAASRWDALCRPNIIKRTNNHASYSPTFPLIQQGFECLWSIKPRAHFPLELCICFSY
jgi:hypothetical protein